MTAETSVPQSWNPPTLEGIRASGPSFSQMEFSCGESGPRSAGTDRGAGVWGSLWNQGVRAWDFARGPLGAQVPSLARGLPTPSLYPAGLMHPAISGPLPPWGSDTWGRGASNWPPWRQTRRHLCPVTTTVKIPLFFHP